ncbi:MULTISPECIES: acyl carrier protein [Nocardia]|uniref:acyl carrier protein n=1 Tax=Nocardia TaxID=1817 RepID=UPI001C12B386|nr:MULTISPECIES: acyl carrier protein [Nocardia]MCZ9325668.1 acyl carrier protein [Nocardia farcinica]UEX25593.1 acyl carrier protein [Nocardia farcinica]
MDTRTEIQQWCQAYLAEALDVDPATIDPGADFDRLGVDSVVAVALLMEIEQRYGVDIPPEELFAEPTLNAVVGYVAGRSEQVA